VNCNITKNFKEIYPVLTNKNKNLPRQISTNCILVYKNTSIIDKRIIALKFVSKCHELNAQRVLVGEDFVLKGYALFSLSGQREEREIFLSQELSREEISYV
jgi:hypothetical protein